MSAGPVVESSPRKRGKVSAEAHGHYQHGGRSMETAATRRLVNEMARLAREF